MLMVQRVVYVQCRGSWPQKKLAYNLRNQSKEEVWKSIIEIRR